MARETISKLRNYVVEQAITAKSLPKDRKSWLPDDEAMSIANGITWLTPLFASLGSEDEKVQQWAQMSLTEYAHNAHIDSIDELKTAFESVRKQLKQELSVDDWNGFFREKTI